jgi:LacI family gluconate utilization system Gnt-I transcriptional repressor
VHAAIEKLGYISNNLAGGLSSRRSRAVVVVTPSFAETTVSRVIDAISRKLSRDGYQVLLANTEYNPEMEMEVLRRCLGWQPAGLILWGVEQDPSVRKLIPANGVAAVEVWNVQDDVIDCAVGFSHVEAGRLITQHVLDEGAQRLAFVRGAFSRLRSADGREAGFRQAVTAAGRCDPLVIVPNAGPLSIDDGAQVVDRIVTEHPDVDAVIFAGETAAVGAVLRCQQRGIAVPQSLMVAGFGDGPLMQRMSPPITTVSPGVEDVAERAVACLVDRIEGRAAPGLKEYVDVEIIVRGSTRRSPAPDPSDARPAEG